jgi:hypothetical protein
MSQELVWKIRIDDTNSETVLKKSRQQTPQIIGALNDIGKTLGQNKNDWSGWADFVSTQINRILIGARTLAQDLGRALDTMRAVGSIGWGTAESNGRGSKR